MKPPGTLLTVVCTSFPGETASDSSLLSLWPHRGQGPCGPVGLGSAAAACPRRSLRQVTRPRCASVSAFVKSWARWGHPIHMKTMT